MRAAVDECRNKALGDESHARSLGRIWLLIIVGGALCPVSGITYCSQPRSGADDRSFDPLPVGDKAERDA